MTTPPKASDISRLLDGVRAGTEGACDDLFRAVYGSLHTMARRCLRSDQRDGTVNPSVLVNEMYIKVFGKDPVQSFEGRAHFFGVAGAAMRSILVDHVRSKKSLSRTPTGERVPLDVLQADFEQQELDVTAIDEVLRDTLDEETARVVDLKLFCRYSSPEIAKLLGLSLRTVERRWTNARTELALHFAR